MNEEDIIQIEKANNFLKKLLTVLSVTFFIY